MKDKAIPNFSYEKRLWRKSFRIVAGADEVGRGAWAGPVVAAAVVFSKDSEASKAALKAKVRIDDSKKLNPKQRIKANEWIKRNAQAWGIGEAPATAINRIGIVKATQMAFRRAIKECNTRLGGYSVEFLLVDAFYMPYIKGLRRKNQLAIVRGDSESFSIAAASIVAKVYRDNLMCELGSRHKDYSWERNKGYGTSDHQSGIRRKGLTRLHRKKFVPLRLLSQDNLVE